MSHHDAHLQIASWLREQPGVLSTRVVGTGESEAILIVHDATIANETRKRITDRLVWFDVRFEQSKAVDLSPGSKRRNAAHLSVLIAEDNRDAADSLAIMVRCWGHEPQVAYDGAEALALAEAWRPSVCFLDLGMPKMDGYALARQLRDWADRPLLVATTGYSQAEYRRKSEEAGFDLHLLKPIDPNLLERLLAAVGQSSLLTAQVHAARKENRKLQEKSRHSVHELGREIERLVEGLRRLTGQEALPPRPQSPS